MTDAIADPDYDITTDKEYLAKRREKFYTPATQGVSGFSWVFTRTEALRLIGEVLYAVRLPDELIKIGWSTNLWLRLHRHDLRGATLLAIKRGDRPAEQALHDSLAAHVHHGREWYYPTPGVMAVVNDWRAALGQPPI